MAHGCMDATSSLHSLSWRTLNSLRGKLSACTLLMGLLQWHQRHQGL